MVIMVYTILRPETTMDPRCRVECLIADQTLPWEPSPGLVKESIKDMLGAFSKATQHSNKWAKSWHEWGIVQYRSDVPLYFKRFTRHCSSLVLLLSSDTSISSQVQL
ncbi:hypothetical protein KIW84_035174 [Lathyrus oleraceus]|uniref:Uncharacterized protein n=1 Tax=Pisum sativum TaxID=3888 RepID=A0A9D5B6C6_PEA|nr:hypothetical protein KIW84_035174 [Pisum sativum]